MNKYRVNSFGEIKQLKEGQRIESIKQREQETTADNTKSDKVRLFVIVSVAQVKHSSSPSVTNSMIEKSS